MDDRHHVPELAAGEHRGQDVPHGLPTIAGHHRQHVHEVLVRFPADVARSPVDEVVEVLDHDVLGQLQISDHQQLGAEGAVSSDHLFVGILLVDVVGDIREGKLANQHPPGSLTSQGEPSRLLRDSFRPEVGELVPHPEEGGPEEADERRENVEPHFGFECRR